MRYAMLLFVFLSELVLWGGLGRAVFLSLNKNKTLAIIIAIVAVTLFILIWSLFFAPKASYRLGKLPRTILIMISSLAIGFALYIQGDRVLGLSVLIGVTIIQFVGQYFLAED